MHLERSRPLTRIPAISLLRPSAKVRFMVHAICSHYKRLPVQHAGDEPIFLRIRHAHSSASKALTTHSCAHLIHTSSNRFRAHSRLHKTRFKRIHAHLSVLTPLSAHPAHLHVPDHIKRIHQAHLLRVEAHSLIQAYTKVSQHIQAH